MIIITAVRNSDGTASGQVEWDQAGFMASRPGPACPPASQDMPAAAPGWRDLPVVHQSGPRRLWDILDDLREYWLTRGYFRLGGARARIEPDGVIHLSNGPWKATINGV